MDDVPSKTDWRRREDRCLTIIALALTTMMIWRLHSADFRRHPEGAHERWLQAASFRLEINRATAVEWRLLPGLGPTLSERIVNDRSNRGPFRSIDEVQRVKGIGPRTLARIRPWLDLGPSAADPAGIPVQEAAGILDPAEAPLEGRPGRTEFRVASPP